VRRLIAVFLLSGCFTPMSQISKGIDCPKPEVVVNPPLTAGIYTYQATCKSRPEPVYTCDVDDSTKTASGSSLILMTCAVAPPNKQPPLPRQVAFKPEEHAPYQAQGTSSVYGQAFLKTRGGDVKYGAGNEVLLLPATSYAKEFWDITMKTGRRLKPEMDDDFRKYIKETTADGEGRFKFESLPTGDYYVVSYIEWEVPGAKGPQKTGGWVGAKVTVKEGEKAEPILKGTEQP
jgi:hypothetical protein